MERRVERVLVVCTGNLCRSPMAAALLGELARRREIALWVDSAGTAVGPLPVPNAVVALAAESGFDLTGHRARPVLREDLAVADLVLGAERSHVRELALLEPGVWHRMFTLKELARRGDAIGPRRAGQALGDWLALAAIGRTTSDLQGSSAADDVADPFGGPMAGYVQMADELVSVTGRLMDLAWPSGA